MIIPLGKSEKLHKYAVTSWITDSARTRARYEFASKIDQQARITCFLYVQFKYGIFRRVFRRGQMEKSRFIATIGGDECEFLYHFNMIRQILWRGYGYQIPLRFCGPDELGTIQFDRGFLGKLKVHLIRAWGALRGER